MQHTLETIFRLDGKTALVTGASSGIGLHLARTLARAGATVILAARRVDKLENAVRDLRNEALNVFPIALDVTRTADIGPAYDAAQAAAGAGIDILINNAGVIYAEKFVDQKVEEIDRVFDTNLKGALLVAQEAARRMLERQTGGSIVNVASSGGLRAGATMASYGASKAALIHLTRIMALELASKSIRVNALCPGNIESDMNEELAAKGYAERLLKRTPMHRFGKPEDLDGPVLLLVSDAGRYMTGSTVTVDGGQTLSWM